ncbi:unnamed protein product [Parascedosporium putredinis]|uniref:mannan endo-1,4-beta-mannosidase n=1 Tax=Parascedosporium putredinis TaxID=1442378 RepID=A0A9P1H4V9_9PEZI|nr:unnamed protein product [Parascedosporium putredinis]CAI7998644.1 unnamed protein product [Parascedosporium putredinis]
MKFSASLAFTLAAAAAAVAAADDVDLRDLPVTREGTHLYLNGTEWKAVGPNVYWLALDENVVPRGRAVLRAQEHQLPPPGPRHRGHAHRQGHGRYHDSRPHHRLQHRLSLSLMPEAGVINEDAWGPIDWAIYQARQHGIRLMVPLVDNYDYYHGGKFDFLRWAGHNLTQAKDATNPAIMAFYEDPDIVASFKSFVTDLLTHRNPLTNLTLAEDPTIFAIESGNELLGPKWGDMNCPAAWVRDVARHVKALAPAKLFVDGTYGVNATHFDVDEVDIFSDHFYPVDVAKLKSDIAKLEDAGRPSSSASTPGPRPPIPLFGRNMPDCNDWVEHEDGFTIKYGDPTNSEAVDARIRLIRKHFTKMSRGEDIEEDEELPVIPCPLEEDAE